MNSGFKRNKRVVIVGRFTSSQMYLSGLGIAVIVPLFSNFAVSSATSFGCKDSLISDEWRQMVLDFHNSHRRRVAQGNQLSKNSKAMPAAKNMNQLYWDCNIEENAFLRNCDSSINAPQGFSEISSPISLTGKNCDINERTKTILNTFWNEVMNAELTVPDYNANTIKNFGIMTNGETSGFACTYNKCSGKLLCLYDKTPNGALYQSGADCPTNSMCAQGSSCVEYLCQLDNAYIPSTKTNPQPTCTQGKTDGMTYDMQVLARDMVNYYRRLVASGWAPDKKNYAPTATKMNAVTYDCDNIGHATNALQNVCTMPSPAPSPGYSLSYHKETDLNKPRIEVLETAITKWAEQLKQVDLDGQVTFVGDVENNAKDFAYMMHEDATEFGCAVADCTKQGFNLAICQYPLLSNGDTVYTTGKVCSGCTALGKKCDNALGGGLCVT